MKNVSHNILHISSVQLSRSWYVTYLFFKKKKYFKDGIKIHSCFKRNIKSTERTDLQNFKTNFKCSAVIIPSVAMSINNFPLIYEELGGEKKKDICIARKLQVLLELFGTFSS